MFWVPVAEECENATQSRLFAPKRTFHAKVAFGWKSAFWAQKVIFGDSGGISTKLDKEFIGFRAFCGFWGFGNAKMEFLWKISHFHVIFMKKVNFMSFCNFSRRVTKITLGFCHPSNGFLPILCDPLRNAKGRIEITYFSEMATFYQNVTIFTKMEVLGWF